MYTIQTSRSWSDSRQYFGTFDTADAANASALLMAADVPAGTRLDVVTIPDGVTPKYLHPKYRAN